MKTVIGEVPDDWELARLDDVCAIQVGPSGTSLRSSHHNGEARVPLIAPKNLHRGRITDNGLASVPPDTAATHERYRLQQGDIVCTRAAALGRIARATAANDGWLFNTGLIRMRPRDCVDPRYLADYLAAPSITAWITNRAEGTAIKTITGTVLGQLPVVLPPLDVQKRIGEALDAVDEDIALHEQIIETTTRLRGVLAPLLLTGNLPATPSGVSSAKASDAPSSPLAGPWVPS